MEMDTHEIPGVVIEWWIGELISIDYKRKKSNAYFLNSHYEYIEIEFDFYDLFKQHIYDEDSYGYIGSELIVYAYTIIFNGKNKVFFDISFKEPFSYNYTNRPQYI